MLNFKTQLLLILILGSSFSMQAQNPDGIELVKAERWDMAKKVFEKSTDESDVFYKGLCEINMDKADAALNTFNTIAEKPYGKIGLGMLELNAGKTDVAKDLFNSAEKMTKGKDPKIFVAISEAYAYSKLDDKSEGINWAKRAVDKENTNANFRINYGNAYLATTDGGSAITQYEYAQQYDPKSAYPDAKIGQTYFRSRTYSMAKTYLYKALDKDPNNLLALNYIAWVYYNKGQNDSAEFFQQKLIKLGDHSPEDMAMLANIYFKQKQYDKAIDQINATLKIDNSYNYLNRLIGYSYLETGKPQEALTFLNKFFQEQPKDKIIASDFIYKAKAMKETGASDAEVVAELNKALELKPDDRETMEQVAATLDEMGKKDEAIAVYEKLAALPDAGFDDFKNLGKLFYTKKNYTKAIEYYTKALEVNAGSAATTYLRALAHLRNEPLQDNASAKPDYLRFIDLSKDYVSNYKKQIVNAKIYLAKDAVKNENDPTLAKQYLNEVLEIDPQNGKAKVLLEAIETGNIDSSSAEADDSSDE